MDGNTKNAAIAAAMNYHHETDDGREMWLCGGTWWPSPPAFDSDASASREMVAWIASDEQRWRRFDDALFSLHDMWAGAGRNPQIRNVLTAPLPVIRDAAFAAIGGAENER